MNNQPHYILRHGPYDEVLSRMPLADLILTSPPYNIGSKAERKDGFRKFGLYDPKSYEAIRGYPDDLPEAEYQATQKAFLKWCATHIKRNGLVVYNHKIRYREGVGIPPWVWFPTSLVLQDMVVWNRLSTHNHNQRHVYQHTELIFVLKRADAERPYVNAGELHHSDVWPIPREFQTEKIHAAPFPLELPRRCIRLWCPPGGIVCDPYAGSGTTAVAARMEGRSFYGAELVKKYADHAKARIAREVSNLQKQVA